MKKLLFLSILAAMAASTAVADEANPKQDMALQGVTCLRFCKIGKPLTVTGTIKNKDYVTVKNPVIVYTLGGGEEHKEVISCTLSHGQTKDFSFDVATGSVTAEGFATVSLELKWPDGSADATKIDNKASLRPILVSRAPNRCMVVEEGTGSWCGWCVRGIVGLREMKKAYPDRFIGIAVHTKQDPLRVENYAQWIEPAIPNYPGCLVNRDGNTRNPSPSVLSQYMLMMMQYADSEVGVTATVGTDAIDVTASVTSIVNLTGARYQLAFVITEDGVPGRQDNFYFDGNSGEMGGFESLPAKVELEYADVARGIWPNAEGTGEKSLQIPTKMAAGVANEFSYRIPLDAFECLDLGRCKVIALLLNRDNGMIENAAECEINTEGIKDLNQQTTNPKGRGDQSAYDLFGRKVSPATTGIKIVNGKKTF